MPDYTPSVPPRVVEPSWTGDVPTLRPQGEMPLAGAMYRQDVLQKHLEAARPLGFVTAQLVRDEKNPHHSGAVAVFLGSDHAGYVPHDFFEYNEGKSLYNALARLRDSWAPATCWAQFANGGSRTTLVLLTGDAGDYGQTKKLDEPYAFPLTIPPGLSRSQVLLTAESQEQLRRSLGRKSQAEVPVSLTVSGVDPNRPRAGGPVLLVALDGATIGALSANNSAPVIPVVKYLSDRNREAVALGWVRASSGARGGLVCSVFARGALSSDSEQPVTVQTVTEQPGAAPTDVPAAWHPDPTGRHELRYWDGRQWGPHVFDNGTQSIDPV